MKEKCKNCNRPSKACISFLMTLSTKETLEWCRVWKDRLGWSNAFLSEKTGTPKGTIDRVLSHAFIEDDAAGVKLATIRPIICALTGCTLQELEECKDSNGADTSALLEKNKALQEELAHIKSEASKQNAFLAAQIHMKDRYIGILAALLALTVVCILGALIVDKLNPQLGFIWR